MVRFRALSGTSPFAATWIVPGSAERTIQAPVTVHRVDASGVAADLENPLGASMVMIGAYGAITGLTGVDALAEAMRASIPSYRTQHAVANERAIRAGWELLPANAHPAWVPDTALAEASK